MNKTIFQIVFLTMTISSVFLNAKPLSIGIVTNPLWSGEYALAHRIESAGKNLGWNVTLLNPNSTAYAVQQFDWVLTLTPDGVKKINYFKSPNYLVLFDPVNHYFENKFCLKREFSKYYGYLKSFEDPIVSKANKKQKIYPLNWYPTAQHRPYKKVLPNKLFYFVGQWGNRQQDTKYQQLQTFLAQQDYACFFGNPEQGSIYSNAYKGRIPYESESIQDQIFNLGVCLILHSDIHIHHKIPSGRIFEAAAAGSVIISDRNPFVEKHFGNSVLYVDQTSSGAEMFVQIDMHMNWIFSHQEEAQRMAKCSYEIFLKEFLLEEQLIQFNEWQQSFPKYVGL